MPSSDYSPTTWGKIEFADLEVPSGQLCQVRPAGINQLVAAGVLESVDTLSSLVDEKHIKRVKAANQGKAPKMEINSESLMKDPEALRKMFSLIDKVVLHMVVQPELKSDKDFEGRIIKFDDRDQSAVYLDSVDLMDKMYIFQYAVGGSPDLEQFRKQFQLDVANVAAS